jgi:putative nucleotidyltransferase with HDIG domain
MSIETAFLRTRVARRVLGLFVLCALLPIVSLTLISFTSVGRQLHQQAEGRVLESGKSTTMSILERLRFLTVSLNAVATDQRAAPRSPAMPVDSFSLEGRIDGVAFGRRGEKPTVLAGTVPSLPALDAATLERLQHDSTALIISWEDSLPSILLAHAVRPSDLAAGVAYISINRTYLFTGFEGAGLPADLDLCVFDDALRPLLCTVDDAPTILRRLEPRLSMPEPGVFEWEGHGQRYVASFRPLFLTALYGTKSWTVVLTQTRGSVLAPLTQFRHLFWPVILLALWVVLLLANFQIRRSMAPLVELQAGTRRIAARDFDSRVHVTSGDEFEDLAASFNTMAQRLRIQFNTLTVVSEIDRAVLSTLDTDHIIDTVARRTRDVLPCAAVGVAVRESNGSGEGWRVVAIDPRGGQRTTVNVSVGADEAAEIDTHPEHFWLNGDPAERSYLRIPPFVEQGIDHCLIVPVRLKRDLAGIIALGYLGTPSIGDDELLQARRLGDQVAVALSNTRLLDELHALTWGALTALARAIDAKSPWTAGHSERVTAMALATGRQLGLSGEQLDTLHRGGLLHDLGKIGVAGGVLDKPTGLTSEEQLQMRRHTEIGARILGPIAAFSSVVPVVMHHHERWDGSGYPGGLVGEQIPLLARVLAVPDVFDAVTSERPYRAGLTLSQAMDFLKERRGTHFDPAVVDAFVTVMEREGAWAEIQRVSLEIGAVRAQ